MHVLTAARGKQTRQTEKYELPIHSVKYEADHAFFNDTRTDVYDETAARDAWALVTGLILILAVTQADTLVTAWLRSSSDIAELAGQHDQRVVEHPEPLQVLDERRD